VLELVFANVIRAGRRIWRLYFTNTLCILVIVLLFAYLDGSHRQLNYKNSVFSGQFILQLSRKISGIEAKILKEFGEIDYVTKKIRTNVTYRVGLESPGTAELMGVEIDTDKRFKEYLTFYDGRFIADENEIMIPSSLLQQIEVKVGDSIMVMGKTAEGQFNTGIFIVCGIYNDPGLNLFATKRLILSYDSMRRFYLPRETDVEYALYFKENEQPPLINKRMRMALSDANHTLITKMESAEITSSNVLDVSVQFTLFLYVIMAIVIFVLVSIVIAVNFNIYMILYRKRKKEIGTLMALGVKPFVIGAILISEAFLQIAICIFLAFVVAHILSFILSFQIVSGAFELVFVLLSGTNRIDLYVQLYQLAIAGSIVIAAMLLSQIPLVIKIILTKPVDMISQH